MKLYFATCTHEDTQRKLPVVHVGSNSTSNTLHPSVIAPPTVRFKKIVHGYIDEFDARGQSTYLLHRTLNHKNPEMFPAGNLKL